MVSTMRNVKIYRPRTSPRETLQNKFYKQWWQQEVVPGAQRSLALKELFIFGSFQSHVLTEYSFCGMASQQEACPVSVSIKRLSGGMC